MKLYLQALSALLWFLWPLSTLAASVTIGDTLGSVPPRAWAAVLVLSVVSGLMALLQRMSLAISLEQQIDRTRTVPELHAKVLAQLESVQIPTGWRLFVTWHMAGAVLTGVLSFLAMESTEINDFLESVVIALCSYGGARFFDRISAVFNQRVLDALARKE